jgi:hypothetical protein
MGERRFTLGQILEQAPEAGFALLADEARRQAGLHAGGPAVLGEVRAYWTGRAETAAEALARWR